MFGQIMKKGGSENSTLTGYSEGKRDRGGKDSNLSNKRVYMDGKTE